ncbi:phosphatase PAP2 family protein [Staphylococcus pseudoxylosus]|uniref:phosphatase PAP2 family protein n=1 Tax=Staphylococcus pseudoxylosus TaxID=2282419 RepID=UPI003905BE6C
MKQNNFLKINKKHIFFLCSSFVLFILLTLSVIFSENKLNNIEYPLNAWFNNYYANNSGFFHLFMRFFSFIGDASFVVILTVLLAIWLLFKKYTVLSLWLLSVIASGGLLGIFMKHIVQRSRPIGHMKVDDGFSFPSGHSIASSSIILVLVLVFLPKLNSVYMRISITTVLLIIWLLVLYSRLYFGAHYLSDIIAGVSFITFFVLFSMCIYKLTANWFRKYIFKRSKI